MGIDLSDDMKLAIEQWKSVREDADKLPAAEAERDRMRIAVAKLAEHYRGEIAGYMIVHALEMDEHRLVSLSRTIEIQQRFVDRLEMILAGIPV